MSKKPTDQTHPEDDPSVREHAYLEKQLQTMGYLSATEEWEKAKAHPTPEWPTHHRFEWDAERAWNKYNLDRARRMCRTHNRHGPTIEQMVNVPSVTGYGPGQYRKRADVVQTPGEQSRALKAIASQLAGIENNMARLIKAGVSLDTGWMQDLERIRRYLFTRAEDFRKGPDH